MRIVQNKYVHMFNKIVLLLKKKRRWVGGYDFTKITLTYILFRWKFIHFASV